MIPKIIHYIWLGDNQIPNDQAYYMKKAKSKLKDYSFKLWTNDDIAQLLDDSKFVQDALKDNKYAFLSDYLRLKILYKYGGIYLDTDVEIKKSFNPFLSHTLFIGYIVDCSLGTAVIGSVQENKQLLNWIEYLEQEYLYKKEFVPNNHWLTKYFLDNYPSFCLDGDQSIIDYGIAIYPKQYFESCKPFYIKTGGFSVHHCAGSWYGKTIKKGFKWFIKKITPQFIKNIRNYNEHVEQNRTYPFYKVWLSNKE